MSYPSLAVIKEHLEIPPATTADDALLTQLRDGAIGYIEGPAGAGRVFAVANDSTKRFDAERDVDRSTRRVLYIWDDLAQITSITNGDGQSVPLADIATEPRNEGPYYALTIKRSSSQVWTWSDTPEDAISITGRWGYSVTPPADIALAMKGIVAYFYRRRASSGDADRPIIGEGGTVIAAAQIPRELRAVVEGYRRTTPR
jgi:hypothetical protein